LAHADGEDRNGAGRRHGKPSDAWRGNEKTRPRGRVFEIWTWRRPTLPRHSPQYHRRGRLNGRVRNGNGCFPAAMATRMFVSLNEGMLRHRARARVLVTSPLACSCTRNARAQERRPSLSAVSTGWLNALRRLHLRPIDVVVFDVPQGSFVLGQASRLDAFSAYPNRS
jgi:hypothetical protein